MTVPELFRDVLLGLSFFVVGMCTFMCWRHAQTLWRYHRLWDVWFLLIYAGVANIVALVGELVWGTPGVPLTWRAISFALGLAAIGVGTLGVAYSVGKRNKRSTDRS